MTAISVIAHPSAAAHHVFGSHMPHEWVLAFGQSCADLLAKHVEDPSTIKGGEHCESLIEMSAALAKVLPIGLPTFHVDGNSLEFDAPTSPEDIAWALHNVRGLGFVTFLLTNMLDAPDDILAVHLFSRSLAHESLSGLTAHFAFRAADGETSRFIRLDNTHHDVFGASLVQVAETLAVSVLGQRAAA